MGITKEKLLKFLDEFNSHFINYYIECVKFANQMEYNNDHFYEGYEKDEDDNIIILPDDSMYLLDQIADFYLFANEYDNLFKYFKSAMSSKNAKEYINSIKESYEKTKNYC